MRDEDIRVRCLQDEQERRGNGLPPHRRKDKPGRKQVHAGYGIEGHLRTVFQEDVQGEECMTKFICTKCKNIVTNIGKINFVTVAKERGYDHFNLCNECYDKLKESFK